KSLDEAAPYFKGVIEEFTVYGYSMTQTELSRYKKKVEYATNQLAVEYITNVKAEYEQGTVKIVSDKDYNNGVLIVATYDMNDNLTGVMFKTLDIKKGETVELEADFGYAVEFSVIYLETSVK
ncbi:MAG: hypothetical protein ACI3XA_06705, partial [Clostridia bacterium]